MKIPATQHFTIAVLLSFFVACLPSLVILFWNWKWNWNWNWQAFSSNPESVTRFILWFVAFGLTGFFWMLFEGGILPHHFGGWFIKIIRGMFIWGPLLCFLIWTLPTIFKLQFAEGLDSAPLLLFIVSPVIGFILSLVLSIYSHFFIKS